MAVTIDGTTGITSPAIDLTTPLVVADGGTGLSSAGSNGNVLTSDGTNWTSTTSLVPTFYYRLNTAVAGANATGAQSVFNVGATLVGSTQYEFELVFALSKTAGTTSHNVTLSFGGTATLNNIIFNIYGTTLAASITPLNTMIINALGYAVSTGASLLTVTACVTATTTLTYIIKGTVSVNAGGTFIPQYTLSAAPGGAYTTQIGSFVKLTRLGASGANINVGSWA